MRRGGCGESFRALMGKVCAAHVICRVHEECVCVCRGREGRLGAGDTWGVPGDPMRHHLPLTPTIRGRRRRSS